MNEIKRRHRLETVTLYKPAHGLVVAAALGLIAACTSNTTAAPPTGTSLPRVAPAVPAVAAVPAVPVALTPSIPSVFTSGTNACGNPYAFNATNAEKTVPLLNCPGQAGSQPLPALTIRTGQQILISGIEAEYGVTVQPSRLMHRHGDTYTASNTGHALFQIHHYPFCSAPTGSIATCPLLSVTINR